MPLLLYNKQSDQYALSRPTYPDSIFNYLASLLKDHDLAWDCATGNGQAAHSIATYFSKVVATDASAEQISNARPHPAVEYRVEPAEFATIESGTVDLVVVATALHWLDIQRFFAEAKRVLKPDGVVAVWTYFQSHITPEIDELLTNFSRHIVGDYWHPKMQTVWSEYREFDLPFQEIIPPDFVVEISWTMEELMGYLGTWSSTQRFKDDKGFDPVTLLHDQLATVWGNPKQQRVVRWKLAMRVGRKVS